MLMKHLKLNLTLFDGEGGGEGSGFAGEGSDTGEDEDQRDEQPRQLPKQQEAHEAGRHQQRGLHIPAHLVCHFKEIDRSVLLEAAQDEHDAENDGQRTADEGEKAGARDVAALLGDQNRHVIAGQSEDKHECAEEH